MGAEVVPVRGFNIRPAQRPALKVPFGLCHGIYYFRRSGYLAALCRKTFLADEPTAFHRGYLAKLPASSMDRTMVGFFDGMDLGHNFSVWKFLKDKTANECTSKAHESYNDFLAQYFRNVTNGQVVDGLDSFYSDYRNRSILVHDAVWLAVNEITGTPRGRLDAMIENWRRSSSK
jgi:hypothetical protein